MRVVVLDDDGYECKVQSGSNPETWYDVDLEHNTCSCPHWTYRCSKTGKPCKHMKEALEAVEKKFAERMGPAGGEPDEVEIADPDAVETARRKKETEYEVDRRRDAAALEQMSDDPFAGVWGDDEVPF